MTAKADKYHEFTEDTRVLDKGMNTSALVIGEYLRVIKEKELYRYGGYDTFDMWRSDNTSLNSKEANRYINIYKFFVEKLKIPIHELMDIGKDLLWEIKKHPKEAVDLIEKARTYSLRDMINEIRELKGKEEMKPKRPEVQPKGKSYHDWVKSEPCVVCGEMGVDSAHWPKTKAVGGKFKIPLCRKHHSEQEDTANTWWFTDNRWQIGQYLDALAEEFDRRSG